MTNDSIGPLLRGFERSLSNMARRIAELESHKKFDTGKDWNRAGWWGFCSPTQPASRIVNVKGGIMYEWPDGTSTGYLRNLPDLPYDFSTFTAFAAQYHYVWCVLRADVSVNPAILNLFEDGTEFGTASECESDFWTNGPSANLYGSYIPLCALVLRNEGTLATVGAIESITLADRTKSYMLARDIRPWLHWHHYPQ